MDYVNMVYFTFVLYNREKNNLFFIALVFVENVRTMSRNFGCKELPDKNKPSNNINVLIPEVIQV